MLWQECRKTDARMRFVARLLEGEKMAGLCCRRSFSTWNGSRLACPARSPAPIR
jgi:hypothetical protein